MKKRKLKVIACLSLAAIMLSIFPASGFKTNAATADSWKYISAEESTAGFASYDYNTDQMSFNVTDGWAGRMLYNDIPDLSGRDYAVEFNVNLSGGALAIYPNFEDATHFSGIALDFGAQTLDGIIVNDTVLDDFSFRETINTGKFTPVVQASKSYAAANNRFRIEFRNGSGGTLTGGSATVYQKPSGTDVFTLVGTFPFGNNVNDRSNVPNKLVIQLWLGSGTVSNFKVEDISPKAWENISPAEAQSGLASYNNSTDTMTFGVTDAWSARLINNEIADLSGKDYAIEFNANLAGGALAVYPNFEDATHFSGIALDFGAQTLDGVIVNDTVLDDFAFRETINTGKFTPVVQASKSYAAANNRLRIEFRNGSVGTLAGGSATVYQKPSGTDAFTLVGTFPFGNNVSDRSNVPNRLVIQLWLGSGTVSNLKVEDITTKAWGNINPAEAQTGLVSYNNSTDTMTFGVTDGWSARLINNEIADLSGKNYAVEFNANLAGGALAVYPNFEDATHFSGIALDFGAQTLDGVIVNDTVLDDFAFRETINTGKFTPVVQASKSYAAANNRFRIEFRNGSGGTLAGGSATVYQKPAGTEAFTLVGTFPFGNNVNDRSNVSNKLVIQLWLGSGSISDITAEEITTPPEEPPVWNHLNDAEKAVGDAVYNKDTDTIILSGAAGWSSRLINTKVKDISSQNFAVEFDSDLGSGGAIGVTPFFEDVLNFYSVYYDIGGTRLDGVGIMGTKDNSLNVIDDFAYINDTLYPFFPLKDCAETKGSKVRIRAEFFLGEKGTMAGGTAYYYYKREGTDKWCILGTFLMPDTITDHADIPNKVVIHGRLTNGTISNINIIENIKEPIVKDSSIESKKWGYVSKYDKVVSSASFSDETGIMTLNAGGGSLWDTRLKSLTVNDVTGKCFALEFNADFKPGGAIGVIPFFESESNWYGVYFDRGAAAIDGVGYKQGQIFDDFSYVNSTLFPSQPVSNYPFLGKFRYRFEYFCNSNGGASGAVCRMFYKESIGNNQSSGLWRLLGEYKIPEGVTDDPKAANKIAIHARLLSGTLSDISYSEISSDTKTKYQDNSTDVEYEDGFPDDSYISPNSAADTSSNSTSEAVISQNPAAESDVNSKSAAENKTQKVTVTKKKITEYKNAPWWSIILIAAGGLILTAGLIFIILQFIKKKKV